MVDATGVWFVPLHLRGHAREWWRTFLRSRPIGSPTEEQDMFSSAFKDYFILWRMREESLLRFERLV
ncbi:hypothetical protein R3W88_033678 [Solanum pinnatisectum]|uniref:Retrotransposon gag domain-containing protein n=1 Tax=Solanum pinnatisectum TaxID=50273 RepID=A0AAV9K0C0_9SOLN|nr:hypothetical protein R3W88_033678 [Solanum pinnatisectum]